MSDFERTCLSRHISSMNTDLKELLLRVELFRRWFSIYDLFRVDSFFDLPLLNQTFERCEIWDMTRHISSKYHPDHSFSECFEFIFWEVLQKVKFFRVEDWKRFCHMEVLLYTLVIVTYCSLADWIYMVRIIKAIMRKIVTNRSYNNTKSVQCVQFRKLKQVSLLHEDE